jgi:hypothetical protein
VIGWRKHLKRIVSRTGTHTPGKPGERTGRENRFVTMWGLGAQRGSRQLATRAGPGSGVIRRGGGRDTRLMLGEKPACAVRRSCVGTRRLVGISGLKSMVFQDNVGARQAPACSASAGTRRPKAGISETVPAVVVYYCRTSYKAVLVGGGGVMEDKCYEIRRAEVCVD